MFNQAHNGLTTPQSPVPLFLSNMSVSFYRFGSGMRVPVKASDAVIAPAVTPRACRLIIHWCGISRPTVLMCSAPRLPTLKPQQLTGQRLPGIPPGLPRRRRQARITAVGAYVTITGAEPAAYNGTVQVLSAPTATSFTFTPVSVPSGNATSRAPLAQQINPPSRCR